MSSKFRLGGLMSGMDTDSIIQQLVAAKQTKVDTSKKAQIKLEWKQDAWKDLNSKLKSLQTKISNMRLKSDYTKKTTKVSNNSAVSVITGSNAVNGVQELTVDSLAKSGYLTGAKVGAASGEDVTALTKISDLKGGFSGEGSFTIQAGDKSVDVTVDENTTISDILTQAKDAGLNASFDAKNQRIFISSKETGKANDFTITANDEGGAAALKALGMSAESGATKIDGEDAQITLNGAVFTNSTNVFEINGLTFTALEETKPGEKVSVTTETDTDGIYDMIKDFLKEYNTVINELDKLYNANAAKGYEPLLTEEKDAMSDAEVEEWEQKIKDSLLRRDENVNTVGSALKSIMSQGVEINGKTMYLSNFGIDVAGYFESADNEKNAYHIAGDADDSASASKDDVLKGMIANDPDTVISFFSKLSQNLYDKMFDMSKSVDGYRSFGNFYDDKKMKTDYDSYTTKISELEEKLNDYEDRWYSKFSKMETAMAKMQSNASAVTGLLGGS